MAVTTPVWETLPDADDVMDVVGPAAYARAVGYAKAGHVHIQTADPARGLIYASVDGTRAQPYQTLVTVDELGLGGRCTCPVGFDCKHVAAVLVAARDELRPDRRTTPEWERLLADAVGRGEENRSAGTPIGLQLEAVVEPQRPRARPVLRVRIRPVVPGKKSPWVRSGISWRDLAFRWGAHDRDDAHRDALHELHRAHHPSGYAYGATDVYLDEFGPALWPLLRSAVEAGVPLVPVRPTLGPVVLSDEPACIAVDLARTDAGDVLASPVVDVPGADGGAGSVGVLGSPGHGVVLDYGGRRADVSLLLAPLDRPLTRQASAVVAAGELTVPSGDVDRFLGEYYPALSRIVTVRSAGDVDLPEVVPPRLGLRLTYAAAHHLHLAWSFVYGPDDAARHVPLGETSGAGRDRSAERGLLTGLRLPPWLPVLRPGATGQPGPAPTADLRGVDAAVFTEEVLPDLREQGVVVEIDGEAPEYRRTDADPVVRVSATDSGDPDWFDLGVTVAIDGEDIPFQDLFVALARGESHLVLDSGTYFSLDRPELEQLRRLIEEARSLTDRPGAGLRLSTYQAGLWEELAALGVVTEQSERWTASVGRLLAGETADPPPVPETLQATLRPYQVEGYQWLSYLWDARLGGILADDMGLGKTLQTLAAVCRAKERDDLDGPVLVVAPTSVLGAWSSEAARFAPGLRTVTVDRTQKRSEAPLAEQVAGADIVVTSYAVFRIDEAAWREQTWSALVLDEAQFVKNHQAVTYRCARRLPAPVKIAITGTPLENGLMDLWSLLSIVAPGMFPDPKVFTETYRRPVERDGDSEALARLRRRIRPFIRRRTKEQVATDLPPKQEQVLTVQLNPAHRRVYQTHLNRERRKVLRLLDDVEKNRFTILRSLTILRQLALDPALVDDEHAAVSSSKADVFLEQLGEVIAGGHRALVFSQFTGFLGTVRDRLDAAGIDYCYLDGATRNRARRIEEFRTGQAPVFLISLKAGGFGLTLTEADYCFVLDPWWNPAAEEQAIDRTHRIGQDKHVMVYRFVAEDTIEEKVLALQDRKRALFDQVVEEGGELAAPLSATDIRELLAP